MKNDTLARFVKDQKLPINIFSEPYFSYFIELYDKDYHSKEAYQMLQDTITQFKSEEAFLAEYYRIRDAVISSMKDSPEYKQFLEMDCKDYMFKDPGLSTLYRNDVYKEPCVGQYFISIDLKAANFQMFRKFNPALIQNAKTYDEFISYFTDMEYFKKSKYTRQVIFGNLNPKRQTTMEKYYTYQILKWLLNDVHLPESRVAVFTHDEIILTAEGFISKEEMEKCKSKIKEILDLDVSVESFHLAAVEEAFVKEKSDGTVAFKNASGVRFPQIYKAYYNMPINENDKVFFYEGRLAKFI